MQNQITLTGENLTIAEVIAVAQDKIQIDIDIEALGKVESSRSFIEEKVSEGKLIYAINTGFGSNASEVIDDLEDTKKLQKNLLLSHACGVGKYFSSEMTRAIMLIRLNTLLAGYSGIQKDTVLLLKALINKEIYPLIPEQGSVGASGDLCPLSHMALPLIAEGEVLYQNERISAKKALENTHLKPIELSYKEGIALNNGTTIMTALGVLAVEESLKIIRLATLSSTLAFEAFGARKQAFDEKIHKVRRHKAQQQIAEWINDFTKESDFMGISTQDIVANVPEHIKESLPKHLKEELEKIQKGLGKKFSRELYKFLPIENNIPQCMTWETIFKIAEKKITPQDAYSIRCTPQVLGASLQAIWHVESVISQELNAVVDNPIIFRDDNEILSGGNFHGQPLALALDYLKLALAEIGNLLERQINKLVDSATNDMLPAFLVKETGLNSGFMIPQYVAASLVSENKVLVHPASADSIPTSANQEDHVSMGSIAGRQAMEILGNLKKIIAIHLLTSAQALDLRKEQFAKAGLKLNLGKKTEALYNKIREKTPYLLEDRLLYEDIHILVEDFDEFY